MNGDAALGAGALGNAALVAVTHLAGSTTFAGDHLGRGTRHVHPTRSVDLNIQNRCVRGVIPVRQEERVLRHFGRDEEVGQAAAAYGDDVV